MLIAIMRVLIMVLVLLVRRVSLLLIGHSTSCSSTSAVVVISDLVVIIYYRNVLNFHDITLILTHFLVIYLATRYTIFPIGSIRHLSLSQLYFSNIKVRILAVPLLLLLTLRTRCWILLNPNNVGVLYSDLRDGLHPLFIRCQVSNTVWMLS